MYYILYLSNILVIYKVSTIQYLILQNMSKKKNLSFYLFKIIFDKLQTLRKEICNDNKYLIKNVI